MELYHKVYQSPRLPRVGLKANSHSGQQDQRDQDAKSSLDPPKESKSYRGNLEQHRWLQSSWHTPFDSRTVGYKSPKQGQEVDRKVRQPSAQGILLSGLEPDADDQQVQQRIAGFDRRHEQPRDLRALRKLFQKAMPRLQYLLGNRHCLLQLWKRFKIFAETKRVRKEQLRRLLNPWFCYYEE